MRQITCQLKSHIGSGYILGLGILGELIKEREPGASAQFQKSLATALPLVYTEKAAVGVLKSKNKGARRKVDVTGKEVDLWLLSGFPGHIQDDLLVVFC